MRTGAGFIAIFIMAGILIIGSIAMKIGGYGNKQTIRTKVTGKERITNSSGEGRIESYYLIYTEAGPLKLEDELLYGNFNSSDWYGQIRQDSTYTFETVGYRIGYLSEYPNIVKFSK
jgi:hypothetical protein